MSLPFCRKVIGIGWNYAKHAQELGNTVPKQPIFFLKPASSIITAPRKIEIPSGCIVHHEIELGVVIGKDGRNILESKANDYVHSYVLALDMTARNVQMEAKSKGQPWYPRLIRTVAKGYDTFTPIGAIIPKDRVKNVHNLQLKLSVDGEVKQEGNTNSMVFDIPKLISYVSSIMTLEKGDLILTGTPDGVGPVEQGQLLTGNIFEDGRKISEIKFEVENRQ